MTGVGAPQTFSSELEMKEISRTSKTNQEDEMHDPGQQINWRIRTPIMGFK